MPIGASVIIPSYRRPEPLQQTLEDLGRQKLVPGEVLIVDQSPEPTFPEAEFTLANGLPVRVLRRPPGVVAARNFAAAAARFEVIVFLDDDVHIEDPAFLETHLRKYEDPAIDGVCGQELLPPDFAVSPPHRSQFSCLYEEAEFFDRRSSEARFVAHLSTCNCSLRKSAFDKVGGFDEKFTGNSYGDDTDLAMRMANAGSRLYFEPAASVRHLKWQRGGLRLSDRTNVANAYDRHLSSWLTYYRHVPPQWRRWYLWHRVLRRQLLIKANVWRLDRWPAILAGIASSRKAARRLLASEA